MILAAVGLSSAMTYRKQTKIILMVWSVAVTAFEGWRIWSVLSGPPSGDLYANHLDFQLFASGFLVLTRWLPLLGVLLLLSAIRDRIASKP